MTAAPTTDSAVTKDVLATGASVGLARSLVSSFLHARGISGIIDAASVIVTELVTNAVKISREPASTVRIHLSVRGTDLWIGVLDLAEGSPVNRLPVATLDEIDASRSEVFGGWGLMLVQAYADRFWIEPTSEGKGKWVCAAIIVRSSA
ncbi:ATP-binding protein [Actinomadura sp. 9N407]|uniref:ATP-binding protein n=1 Tax=Actinomadura sp. 9N407 TaxID=3375154 RepID=UPI00379B9DD4